MSAIIEVGQPPERSQLETSTESFQILLCVERDEDRNELEAVLGRLRTHFKSASCVEQAEQFASSADSSGDRGTLTIFSFGFSQRSVSELIALQRSWSDSNPIAFWTRDAVGHLEDIVTAIRGGAVDVLHGTLCDAKMELLIAQSRMPQPVDLLEVIPATNGSGVQVKSTHGVNENGTNGNGHAHFGRNGHGTNGKEVSIPGAEYFRNGDSGPSAERGQSIPATPLRNGKAPTSTDGAQLLQIIRGRSSSIEAIRNVIRHVAPTQATVMIHGESGTGKELVARAIHSLSKRADQPFVPVNMAAIPNGLAESFLFGHEKGAFTSAVQKQKGWCRVAHGGTLFLDEIGEMELEIQPKLLRFLQEGSLQTVGAQAVEKVDVRLVTATDQDPREVVRSGRLREDLFFRLNVIPIYIPPLRDRCDDIEELAMLFLLRAVERHERPVRGYTDEAMEVLTRHDWPGNVRQLENMVERLVIFAKGDLVEAMEIPAEIHAPSRRRHFPSTESKPEIRFDSVADELNDSPQQVIDRLSPFQVNERTVIIDALQRAEGHVIRAAQLLGLGQATMYRKIKQYVIPHQRKRRRTAPK